jgi:hypothetical protein
VERGRLVGWLPRYRLPVKGHFAMVASCYFFEPTLGAKIWSRRLVLAFVRREARRYGTIDLLVRTSENGAKFQISIPPAET